MSASFCFNCGKNIPDKAKFCPFCGEDLSDIAKGAEEKPAESVEDAKDAPEIEN